MLKFFLDILNSLYLGEKIVYIRYSIMNPNEKGVLLKI